MKAYKLEALTTDEESLLRQEIEKLEAMVDNAYSALEAIKCSGSIIDNDVLKMLELGLDNKPQLKTARFS